MRFWSVSGASQCGPCALGLHARWTAAPALELTGKASLLLVLVALEGQAERRCRALMLWTGSVKTLVHNNLRTLVYSLNQR
jgi:hypothetical protein